MPGIEISALPAATAAQTTDVFPADQLPGPVTRKITIQQILNLVTSSLVASVRGTLNQIDVDNTDPQNPILSLPSTLIAPGTVQTGNLLLDTNTFSSINTNGDICLVPNGTGSVIIGTTFNDPSTTASIEIPKTGASPALRAIRYVNAPAALGIDIGHSRGATLGSQVSLVNNDSMGTFRAFGSDGTSLVLGGQTGFNVDGTPSTGIMPSRFTIHTISTSGTFVAAVVVNSSQNMTVTGNVTASTSFAANSPTVNQGSISLTCANNSGNYANVLTNAATSSARTWTLPNASGTIALVGGSAALSYTSVSGTSQAAIAGNGYILNNSGATTVTLPTTASSVIGDTIKIKGRSSVPWIIQANTGQIITIGNTSSATAGTLTSSDGKDSLQLVYVAANEWSVDWALSDGVMVLA